VVQEISCTAVLTNGTKAGDEMTLSNVQNPGNHPMGAAQPRAAGDAAPLRFAARLSADDAPTRAPAAPSSDYL
jgi:hypothetical protein